MLGAQGVATDLVLALSVSSASFTIARTKVATGFRAWAGRRSKWLGSLVACPYCVSHYLAAAGVAAFWQGVRIVDGPWPFTIPVTWLSIVAVAAFFTGMINRAITPVLPPAPQAPFRSPVPRRPTPPQRPLPPIRTN